jgi:hypothetical protein
VCLRVTQDNEVFAVVGGFLGPAEPANTCIAGQQSTILVGGVQSEERLGEARAPWITDRPLRTRQAEIMFSLLEQEGMIEGRSVAVVTNIDAQDVRSAVRDTLADFDVEPVEDLSSTPPSATSRPRTRPGPRWRSASAARAPTPSWWSATPPRRCATSAPRASTWSCGSSTRRRCAPSAPP